MPIFIILTILFHSFGIQSAEIPQIGTFSSILFNADYDQPDTIPPYNILVKDNNGKTTGWLTNNDTLNDIKDAEMTLFPQTGSDPDDTLPVRSLWYVQTITVEHPAASNKYIISVFGKKKTKYDLSVTTYKYGGESTTKYFRGKINKGETVVLKYTLK